MTSDVAVISGENFICVVFLLTIIAICIAGVSAILCIIFIIIVIVIIVKMRGLKLTLLPNEHDIIMSVFPFKFAENYIHKLNQMNLLYVMVAPFMTPTHVSAYHLRADFLLLLPR